MDIASHSFDMLPVDPDYASTSRSEVSREPAHRLDEPVSDTLSQNLSSHLEGYQSRLLSLRKVEDYSVDSPHLAAVAVDQFLVKDITDYAHFTRPR